MTATPMPRALGWMLIWPLLIGAGATAFAATRVRYCWGDSPTCTLTDSSGLPATPFEAAIDAARH